MKFLYFFCSTMFLATSLSVANVPDRMNDAIKIQVLLDRANFSPGEIDGSIGSNTERALAAFQQAQSLQPTGTPDQDTLAALDPNGAEPTTTYTIQPEDVGVSICRKNSYRLDGDGEIKKFGLYVIAGRTW